MGRKVEPKSELPSRSETPEGAYGAVSVSPIKVIKEEIEEMAFVLLQSTHMANKKTNKFSQAID